MIKIKPFIKKILSGNPLKIVCVIGIALALIISFIMLFSAKGSGKQSGVMTTAQNRNFSRELEAYDFYNAPKRVLDGENPAQIEKQLSRLKKQARGVEETLSVLKRRRALAIIDRQYIGAYAKAAREAAETFGYSAPIAAVASDALILGGAPLQPEERAFLKKYASRISQTRFESLELGLHILAGNLDNPSLAAGTPALEKLLSTDFAGLPRRARQDLLTDEFLLRAVKGDIPGAALRLNTLLGGTGVDDSIRRAGAEFFYDHQNPLKAGELFSMLQDEKDLERAADSLVLAGETAGARNIWLALASPENSRSLYNLASSSADPEEQTTWLEKLLSRKQGSQEDSIRIYSIIRYTRLKENSQSTAILDEFKQHPLLDLELLRRRLEMLPPTRSAAEVWMLLGRHSEDEAIYEWAAWYFDHQKLYSETARVLLEAGRKGMSGYWIALHKSLALLREGKISEGEKILKGISASDWRIPANLGRIQENRRSFSTALEYYEQAAALINSAGLNYTKAKKSDAALIQMRISRCLEALGRTSEAWRALDYAAELDPENINIRRELRRFEGST